MSYEIPVSTEGDVPPFSEVRKYNTMLEAMHDHIFAVEWKGTHFQINEQCDGYFHSNLTPDQLRALGEELIEMALRHGGRAAIPAG